MKALFTELRMAVIVWTIGKLIQIAPDTKDGKLLVKTLTRYIAELTVNDILKTLCPDGDVELINEVQVKRDYKTLTENIKSKMRQISPEYSKPSAYFNSMRIYENVYGDTLRKIIQDIQAQIRDYSTAPEIDQADKNKLVWFRVEEKNAVEIYNSTFYGEDIKRVPAGPNEKWNFAEPINSINELLQPEAEKFRRMVLTPGLCECAEPTPNRVKGVTYCTTCGREISVLSHHKFNEAEQLKYFPTNE